MSMILQITGYLIGFYILCVVLMYFAQGTVLFFPTSSRHTGHKEKQVEDFSLEVEGSIVRGWLVNPKLAKDKLVIYYGGNAEDIFLNIDEYRDIQAASLFVNYRGYGPSSGKPGEKQLFSDALAVIDTINKKYSPEKLFLVGRSLGTGVACYVASKWELQGIVLITPYDSIVNVAKQSFWWLPVGLLLKHRFVSTDYIKNVSCPILVLYGGVDQVISPERTENLVQHIAGQKEVQFIERADHSSIDMFPEYWESILRFINQ